MDIASLEPEDENPKIGSEKACHLSVDGWVVSGSSPPSITESRPSGAAWPAYSVRLRKRKRNVEYQCINCGKPGFAANKNAKFCPPPSSCRTQYNRRIDPVRGPVLVRADNHCERCARYSIRLYIRNDKAICAQCNSAVSAEISGTRWLQRHLRRSGRLPAQSGPISCVGSPKEILFSAFGGVTDGGMRIYSLEHVLARCGAVVPDFVDELLERL